jgi:hypothetical protein
MFRFRNVSVCQEPGIRRPWTQKPAFCGKNTIFRPLIAHGSNPALGTYPMFRRRTKYHRTKSVKRFASIFRCVAVVTAWLLCVQFGRAQTFQDYFTNRQTLTTATGTLAGDNSTATIESGEPLHAGKPGGHSLWISWIAPSNGIARFKTETSGFDTLLAAYFFNSTNDATFNQLIVAARNDDSEELDDRESKIDFPVQAGQRYEIAVDGYYGAVGNIKMQWSMDVTASPPPRVIGTTPDTTLQIGVPITLTVVLTNAPNSTKYQWFLNGVELADEKNTSLVISSMQVTNVGRYKLQIDVGSHITFFSFSTELQINTEGADALAQSKFPDAPSTELVGGDGSSLRSALKLASSAIRPAATPQAVGVVRGYNGTQIFNTTFATIDPAEPMHCSVTGGYSYWLAYQPPTNGTITLDTIGSTYDTVLEVYSYNVPPTTYPDLISLVCDHGSVVGGSRIQLAVTKTRQYAVVVAGVNGAKGTVFLNYSLNTNQLPQAPQIMNAPQVVVVTNGADVMLIPPISGTPPLHFFWTTNSAPMTNSYDPVLLLPRVTPAQTGDYSVVVTNDLGKAVATMPLHVVDPPSCSLVQKSTDSLQMNFATQAGLNYTVEEASDIRGPWQPQGQSFTGDGQTAIVTLPGITNGFYRVRVQ